MLTTTTPPLPSPSSHSSLSSVVAYPTLSLALPQRLEGLRRLAFNLYWSWHPRVRLLWKRIDPRMWSQERNPLAVLEHREDWSDLLDNADFMAEYETLLADFDAYLAGNTPNWFARQHAVGTPIAQELRKPVAYFCAEFGLHESLNIYSGGLGILAGDHLKTASDMGLPFVAVGLLYRQGYFRQSIDADGHQEHAYPSLDPHRLPLGRVVDPRTGRPLEIAVELPGRSVVCAVWLAQVGRVPLFLLDTDVPDNAAADRPITAQLYVRGREMRLHQELVLGVGGVRVLDALSIEPSAWHLNEGHSAFMIVERIRALMQAGTTAADAFERVRESAVFTIHTPVSAGNEKFDAALVRRLTKDLLAPAGLDIDRILQLGIGENNDDKTFDMTAFSLRMSRTANAVSKLHGETANHTWQPITGKTILGLTNGVHVPTWIGPSLLPILEEAGIDVDDVHAAHQDDQILKIIDEISNRKLWDGHQRQKLELIYFIRQRLRRQLARHGEAPSVLAEVDKVFDPNVLTIGFARRFATYKRAWLLFSDEERLARLLWHRERPVQIVFAGKAHPADRPGQKMIQEIFQKSRSPRFKDRIVVIEDYDMRVGRFLVQGVDVWLNNPRRPLEASGTSGMKAGANGVLNLSVLDGWWDEGYCAELPHQNGWAIGGRTADTDESAQDRADAESLYQLLENEVTPLYYARDALGLPSLWLERMRASMRQTLWPFSTSRMLEEYVTKMYIRGLSS